MSPLVVAVTLAAGALGAVLRYGTAVAFGRMPARLPWAVFLVNVVGSAIGGVVLGLSELGVIGADARLVVLSGFAGGLTTFSTLSVETIQLVQTGRTRAAVVSVVANVVLGVAAVALACGITLGVATLIP